MTANKENMNIKEIAEYLNCSISTVRKLIYNDEIPVHRIGNRYYANKSMLTSWLSDFYVKDGWKGEENAN